MVSNPTSTDRIQYTLKHDVLGRRIVPEPLNFKTDYKRFTRTDTHGFTNEFDSEYEFIDEAAEYLDQIINAFGANTRVYLIKDERNPYTDIWEESYSAELDMLTYSEINMVITIEVKKGGLERYLEANEGTDVELNRVKDLKGDLISAMPTTQLLLEARRVFLISNYSQDSGFTRYTQQVGFQASNINWHSPFPFRLESSGVEYTNDPFPAGAESFNDGNALSVSGLVSYNFLYNASESKTYNLTSKMKGTIKCTRKNTLGGVIGFHILLTKYVNGDSLDLESNEQLYHQGFSLYSSSNSANRRYFNTYDESNYDISPNIGTQYSFDVNINRTLNVQAGESYALLMVFDGFNQGGSNINRNTSDYTKNYFDFTLEEDNFLRVTEDSVFPDTLTKAVTLYDYANQACRIITNGSELTSEFLSNGFAKNMLVSHGFWIRQFSDGDDIFKPIEVSFKDVYESIDAVFNTGIGVETHNGIDKIVLEDVDYFYQDFNTIRLTDPVSNINRYPAADKYFNSITLGYEKGGDYDETIGLNEFNTRATYTTENDVGDIPYEKLCKLRTDSYGVEFPRRQPKSENETKDTTYDEDKYLFSCKENNGRYSLNKYNDVLTELPTGVFSPETAYNYDLTPFNILKRHSNIISTSLSFTDNPKITYASGGSAVSLKTSLGSEKTDTDLNEIGYSKFKPEIIEFEYGISYEMVKHLSGFQNVGGRMIPRIYGKIHFPTDRGEESGWIVDFDPEGKFKVLKSK